MYNYQDKQFFCNMEKYYEKLKNYMHLTLHELKNNIKKNQMY